MKFGCQLSYFNFSIPTSVLVSYFRYMKVRESLNRTITGRQRTTKTNSFGAKFQNGGAKQYSGPRPEFVLVLLIDKNLNYSEILEEIKSHFPDFKGCSLRSLKRFCSQHQPRSQGLFPGLPHPQAREKALGTRLSQHGINF